MNIKFTDREQKSLMGSTNISSHTSRTTSLFFHQSLSKLLEPSIAGATSSLLNSERLEISHRLRAQIMKGRPTEININDCDQDHERDILTKIKLFSPQQKRRPLQIFQTTKVLTKTLRIPQEIKAIVVIKGQVSKENFIKKIQKVQGILQEQLRNCSLRNLTQYLQKIVINAVRTENPIILAQCLKFIGVLCLRLREHGLSVYFLAQVYKICSIHSVELIKMKLDCLILLGRCARELKDYPFAISLFKKALQYAWVLNERSLETAIYDHLGVSYYFSGMGEKAQFYHERAVLGSFEADDSPIRQQSNIIMNYLINPPIQTPTINPQKKITQALLNKLNLNFISIENGKFSLLKERVQQSLQVLKLNSIVKNVLKSQRCADPFGRSPNVNNSDRLYRMKTLQFMKIDPVQILDKLLQHPEFEYTAQTPKKAESENYHNTVVKPIKFFHKNHSKQVMSMNLKSPFKKLSLDQLIELRNKELLCPLKKPYRIYSNVHDKVIISHFSHQRAEGIEQDGLLFQDILKILNTEFNDFLKSLSCE